MSSMYPTIVTLDHESQVLRGNPLGDPSRRRLPVYLPPDYDSKRKDPYPVVYLLSGFGGRGAQFLNDDGVFSITLPERFDRMIRNKEMAPVLVVMPDAGTKFGGSQYINSEGTGRYMDYLCDELVPFVDGQFNTYRSPQFRGVAGHSSGGFGALVTGMNRPDCFLNVCSSAGDSWYEYLYLKAIPTMMAEIEKAGGLEKFISTFLECPSPRWLLSPGQLETMMNLAMCACYAPKPNSPTFNGEIYFDLKTGEMLPEVWKRFMAWDPVHMVHRYKDNLKKLRWIHLEAGTEDEYGLHVGHRQVAKRLSQEGIEYSLEEYPGKHGGHAYRFGSRIQKMLQKMFTA